MKTTTRPSIATLILATTIAALLSAPSARAVVGQWTGGSTGTWDISSANWSGGSNPAWDLANGPLNTAVFATAGDATAISGGVYLNQITFNTAATVTGSTPNSLRFSAGSGQTITLEQNDVASTAIISAGIGIGAAAANSTGNILAKTGAGKLTLSGTHILTGTTDGGNFTGQLKVDGGGELNLTGSLQVASATGATNRSSAVSVIGATTGGNTLSVTGGGRLVTGNVSLGNGTNGNTINLSPSVAGSASAPTWMLYGNGAQLNWNGSNNTVNFSNGAYVEQVSGGGDNGWRVGDLATHNNNTFLVDGPGSTFSLLKCGSNSNGGFIRVGNAGSNNTFIVRNGGTILGGRVTVGGTGSFNTELITGAGSRITANLAHNGNFEIGQGAGASGNAFRVEAGAVVKYSGNTNNRQFSVGETASSNDNFVRVTGAGSQLHLIQSALPLVIGGSQTGGGVTINSGGSGNHLDVGSGGWLNLNNSRGTVSGLTVTGSMAMVLTGTGSAFNLGDGIGISTAHVGATGAITGVSLRGADSRLHFNGGRLIAGVNGDLVSGPGQIQLAGPAYLSTAFTGSTIASAIGGSGSLTKEGAGTLTLTGANTYTGDTTVTLGTLSISSPCLADGADIYLATGAYFQLNTAAATDTVRAFYIDGIAQPAGIWGALGSGAANQTSLLTGSGRLEVNPLALTSPGEAVPEPSAALLLSLSSALLAGLRRRR